MVLSMAIGANAQQRTTLVSKHNGNPSSGVNAIKPSTNKLQKSMPIWSDDFSNAATWTMTNTSAPISWDWVITTNQADIPNAAPDLQPFMSATAANGFALIDSDGQPGNTDGNGAIVAEMTNVTPIDLTLYPNVVLKFSHSYRWWQDTRGVRVSGNNGASWTEFEITSLPGGVSASGFPNDQNSENPTEEVINISAAAGGEDEVLIQFYYNDNDIWGWYWTVDDVEILEQPLDDIQLLSSWIVGQSNEGVEYGRTPLNHLDASWIVGGEVYNFGVNTQTNLDLEADFVSFSANALEASLATATTVLMETNANPTLAIGTYTGTYTVVSDGEVGGADFGNNVYLRNFAVTDNIYSQDGIDIHPASMLSLSSIGTNSFVDPNTQESITADGFVMASLYHMKAAGEVSGLRIMLAAGTVAGGEIVGSIMDTSLFWQGNMTALHNTGVSTVSAQDITNGYIDLWFNSVISLNPGAYYAAVTMFSNDNANTIRILDDQTVAQPAIASAIYVANDGSYTDGTAFGIRMLTGSDWGVGIAENTLTGVSVYPNPSEGVITVTNDNNTANAIEVHDMLGKVVYTSSVSTSTTIDLSGNGTGVYIVKVSNETGSLVERVVIR